jgi:hypothetical protein
MRDPLNRGSFNPAPGGLRMPESCTLRRIWSGDTSSYICGLLYTGLTQLFAGSSVRLTGVVKDSEGGGGFGLPDVDVRCIGDACRILSNATFCNAREICGGSLICQDFAFGATYAPLNLAKMDLVGDTLWSASHSGCCSWQNPGRCSDAALPVCSTLDFRRDIHDWVLHLADTSSNTGEGSSSLRLCSIDAARVDPHWSGSQIVRSGTSWLLRGLEALGALPASSNEGQADLFQVSMPAEFVAEMETSDGHAAHILSGLLVSGGVLTLVVGVVWIYRKRSRRQSDNTSLLHGLIGA